MTKEDKIKAFDPDGLAINDGLFGLPFDYAESETIVLPVPWEVTVSYNSGTADAPEAILEASRQVDLYDPALPGAWKKGIYMIPVDEEIRKLSEVNRRAAELHINMLEKGNPESPGLAGVNLACEQMVHWVKEQSRHVLGDRKRLILLGGDHSTPLGYIQALSEQYPAFGVLQIDAHADLRIEYEGFKYSHASIMYNVLKIPAITGLVQVGIRDYGHGEAEMIAADERINCFFDKDLKQKQYEGKTWSEQCDEIVSCLPDLVYLSFDIDGLDPKLCPNTGTPVAGGFEAEEVLFLVGKVVESGKTIIGMDLNEVSPADDEWDANVGARLLFRLANLMALSQSDN